MFLIRFNSSLNQCYLILCKDLDQFGIAPRQIQRTSKYNQQDWQNERAVWDPVVPGLTAALSDVIKPVR